ncbi:MAG: hypothetical protein ACRCZF_04865 [Gemmataceae bacterium]
MNTIINVQSGPDAKLYFDIPVDQPGTEYEVVLSVRQKPKMTPEAWRAWVTASAGTWQGEFERPEPCLPEERNPL